MKVIEERIQSKPFLKWAGGKTQLLNAIVTRLPIHILLNLQIDRYVEPFIGSGAVFFFLKKHFHINESYLIDSNPELILGYQLFKRTGCIKDRTITKWLSRLSEENQVIISIKFGTNIILKKILRLYALQ